MKGVNKLELMIVMFSVVKNLIVIILSQLSILFPYNWPSIFVLTSNIISEVHCYVITISPKILIYAPSIPGKMVIINEKITYSSLF